MRISFDDSWPGKGGLLEAHADDDLDDAADRTAVDYIGRFVALGQIHLGDPTVPARCDLRIRMQGHSSHWGVFEYSRMTDSERNNGILRLAQALASHP